MHCTLSAPTCLPSLELSHKVFGTLSTLILDHMAGEECYTLTKRAKVAEIEQPNCDPTNSRIEM